MMGFYQVTSSKINKYFNICQYLVSAKMDFKVRKILDFVILQRRARDLNNGSITVWENTKKCICV